MMRYLIALIATVTLTASIACSNSATSPSRNDTTLVFGALTPAPGSTLFTSGATPGAFITSASEKLWIPITIRAGSDESIARLFVYLKDQNGISCGQNLPDAPDLAPLKSDTTQTYVVRAFQVFRLPCEVTTIRAVLHRRESRNLNTEITADEKIADHSVSVNYHLR